MPWWWAPAGACVLAGMGCGWVLGYLHGLLAGLAAGGEVARRLRVAHGELRRRNRMRLRRRDRRMQWR